MNRSIHRRGLALALGVVLTAPLSTALAAPAGAAPRDATAVEVTAEDVAASNAKVQAAYRELAATWQSNFAQIGARFVTPRLLRYRGAVRSACGVMSPNNAFYCVSDNSIYFDDVFVAGQAKLAARALGTDGDMAAIGVVAHEMGHAVAMQLGRVSRVTYQNEATADCLAGAFALQADRDGQLEPGDVDEAFHAMASAGDPTPELTGDARTDRVMLVRAARMSHGTQEQRLENFRAGLEGGPGACLAEFRRLR